jgi:rifampicin phosphotransferase
LDLLTSNYFLGEETMLGDKWICDRTPTDRFPDYTRGNAAEVMAEPASPLGWTFSCEPGMVLGCRDGFEQMGVFDAMEYSDPPECFGLFGGYFYNSLTQARLFGVRSGAGWQAIDQAYFDPSQNIPPYVEKDWHNSARHAEKLGGTVGWVLTTDSVPETELNKLEAKAVRDSRPDFDTQSNEQILARARSLQRHQRSMFAQVVWTSLGASVGPGVIAALTGEIDPTAGTKLVTGVGDVDSADIATRIFAISRTVNASPALSAEFDAGIDGLLDRVAALGTADAAAFQTAVDEFMYVHGGRGPGEWDIYQWGYETKPSMLVQAVQHARGAGDEADPARTIATGAAERARLVAQFEEMFADNAEALGMFQSAVKSAGVFMAARERCKSNNIRVYGEVRMCFNQIGRRMVAAGHLAHERQIYMLVADELDAFLADPGSFSAVLAERETDYLSLYELDPPYIIDGAAPPLSEWPKRNSSVVEVVKVGDVLKGVAGSPGVVTGTARVLLNLDDPSVLEPGDILIAPATDPSWTPLFLAAGGVITNIGAVGTHAVIVSRELGIPCVPSIPDATRRIPDGATVTVDGTNGTVTIDALP